MEQIWLGTRDRCCRCCFVCAEFQINVSCDVISKFLNTYFSYHACEDRVRYEWLGIMCSCFVELVE